MKINIEVDITPDELRRFMGLPDVYGMQQNLLDQFAQRLQDSADQRDEFMQSMFRNAMGPWQTFANIMANASMPSSRTGDDKAKDKEG